MAIPQKPSHLHPASRGYLRGIDEAKLAQRLHQPPYEQLWRMLEERTAQTIARVYESQFGITTGSLGWHSRTPMLCEAALLARLNHDTTAVQYIVDCINYVTQQKPATERAHLLHSYAQIAIAADIARPTLPDSALKALCKFMRDVAIPFNNPDPANLGPLGNNIHWVKSTQTATCALLWGQDSQSPNWQTVVDQSIRHTQGYLRFGQDKQGYSYEGTGYGQSVLRFMFPFAELLRLTNYANLYSNEPGLLAAADAVVHSMFPDQKFLTNDNDHGLSAASSLSYLLLAHNAYNNPNHLAAWYAYQGPNHPVRPFGDQEPWLAKQLDKQQPNPEDNASLFLACLYWNADTPWQSLENTDLPTTQFAHGTGKLNLRTSWSKDAAFLQFLGAGRSNMSQTHRHADAGHFSIFAHGEYLAIDTGRYNSDEDQHSVVLIDNKCHAPTSPGWDMDHHQGRLEGFVQEHSLTYACADMAQIKGCYWAKRHLLAIDYADADNPDQLYVITVDDINKDNALHDFTWQLQGHPDARFEIVQVDAALASELNGNRPHARLLGTNARLDMYFVAPTQQPQNKSQAMTLTQDIKEWQWPYGKSPGPNALDEAGLLLTSVRRPRLLATLHQQQGRVLSVIIPRRSSEPSLNVTRAQATNLMSVTIDLGQYTDTILASPSYGFMDTPDLCAFTELLWYRSDKLGNVIKQWTLGDEPIVWKTAQT